MSRKAINFVTLVEGPFLTQILNPELCTMRRTPRRTPRATLKRKRSKDYLEEEGTDINVGKWSDLDSIALYCCADGILQSKRKSSQAVSTNQLDKMYSDIVDECSLQDCSYRVCKRRKIQIQHKYVPK